MITASGQLETATLSERIRDAIIHMVIVGTLRPGERLNEVHLAERLGTSRSPVREALKELEGLGLTISRPRFGFYVADYSAVEIREIYEVSSWIHSALIEDFLTYLSPEVCAEIQASIDHLDTADVQSFSSGLLAFRQGYLARAHNRYLAELALGLYRRFFIVAALVRADDMESRIQRIMATTKSFWAALAARDRDAAQNIIADDITYWLKDVSPRFRDGNDGAVTGDRKPFSGPA